MSNAIDINSYNFTNKDALFIDTNIWYYIYGPQGEISQNVRVYSKALNKIYKAKSSIYIDVLIMSEFINRYSKEEYNRKYAKKYGEYKKYRQSKDFTPIAKDIAIASHNILKRCQPTTSFFESMNVTSVLTDYEKGNVDFNDKIIANICVEKGLKLITHDFDFATSSLNILTARNEMLNPPKSKTKK